MIFIIFRSKTAYIVDHVATWLSGGLHVAQRGAQEASKMDVEASKTAQ